jgi:multiple sugar transport system substrate-binding protein
VIDFNLLSVQEGINNKKKGEKMKKNKLFMTISLLVVFSFVIAACGGAAAPEVEAPAAEEAPVAEEAPAAEEEAEAPAVEEVEPVTIDVWFHSGKGEEREVLDEQVTTFNEMQDEIYVNAIILPEGSYNDQVNAAALAGDLPCLLGLRRPLPE